MSGGGREPGTVVRPEKLGDIMAERSSKTGKAFVYGEEETAAGGGAQSARLGSEVAPFPDECDCSMNDLSENVAQSM